MHRERWQFIRVPRIVDTYYHAKYNMLTTSHNVGPRSSRFSLPVRPFGESRFRAQKILLPMVRQMRLDSLRSSCRRRRASFPFPEPPASGNENLFWYIPGRIADIRFVIYVQQLSYAKFGCRRFMIIRRRSELEYFHGPRNVFSSQQRRCLYRQIGFARRSFDSISPLFLRLVQISRQSNQQHEISSSDDLNLFFI